MAQELGRISRPSADQYKGRRKLLLAPLVYGPTSQDEAGAAALQKYWDQMQEQVAALQSVLGGLDRIFHESLVEGGPVGLEQLKGVDQRSYNFIQAQIDAGTSLEATESADLLLETLDLQRCMMVPLASEKVALQLREWFTASNAERYQYIAQQIDQTLGEGETGVLLISERHQVQLSTDIEVFYVSPPALNEYRRWLQNWLDQQQRDMAREQAAAASSDEPVGPDEAVDQEFPDST